MLRRPFESTQYASGDYQELLAQHGLRGSMSRRGDSWDNAVAEGFFATLKLELVYQVQWPTRAAVRTAVFEYLELFYNRRRRHCRSAIAVPQNLNDVTINGWQLNPGVHQLGASSPQIVVAPST